MPKSTGTTEVKHAVRAEEDRPTDMRDRRRQILRLVHTHGAPRTEAALRYDLGLVHAAEENWEEAHRHFVAAAEAAELCGDGRLVGLCRMRQASLYLRLGCLEAAREVAEQAVSELAAAGGEADRIAAVQLLATVLRHLGCPTVADFRQQDAGLLSPRSPSGGLPRASRGNPGAPTRAGRADRQECLSAGAPQRSD